MKLPYRFEDMTLYQFMQLHELEKDKIIDRLDKDTKKLSILSGESFDYVESIDLKERREALARISYVNHPPKNLPVVKRFRAKGTLLVPTTSLQDMKVNQLVDFYTLLKQSNNDYISNANMLLAVMFKPVQLFGKAIYNPENHSKINQLLLDAKVGDCLGLLFFYLDFWRKCEPRIMDCLKQANQTIEGVMNEIMNDQEFLDSLNSGGGSTM